MKLFKFLCVGILAVLLENAFADPLPEPKSSSNEFNNKNRGPEELINLMFYSRSTRTSYPIKTFKKIAKDDNFIRTRPTVVYFHCLAQDALNSSVTSVVDTLLTKNTHNIVILDWSFYSQGQSNFENMPDLQNVAATIAPYFSEFVKTGWLAPQVYFIGFGVGANLAAAVARELRSIDSLTLERITALDPFMPSNYAYGSMEGINRNDAAFVDIIHTSVMSSNYFGTVDFYPNGGRSQPGCENYRSSHNRAWELFAESINSPLSFLSMECKSWEIFVNKNCRAGAMHGNMGIYTNMRLTGNFFLYTNERPPYSRFLTDSKSNKSFSNSDSSSSSSSDESNVSKKSYNKNKGSQERGSNESLRNNEVRQNFQRNLSGSRSNERKNKDRRTKNQGGKSYGKSHRKGSNERKDQTLRDNSNESYQQKNKGRNSNERRQENWQ